MKNTNCSVKTAQLLGIPSPPPFADPTTSGNRILQGVNHASAAAGILDESGYNYVFFLSLSSFFVIRYDSVKWDRGMMVWCAGCKIQPEPANGESRDYTKPTENDDESPKLYGLLGKIACGSRFWKQ